MGTDLDYSLYYRVWHDESDHHVRRMVAYHRRILGPWINGLSPGEALDIGDLEAYKTWLVSAADRLGGCDIFVAGASASGSGAEPACGA